MGARKLEEEGAQWAVGFKQGTSKDGDLLPWTRS
jgi:hypothetical protein